MSRLWIRPHIELVLLHDIAYWRPVSWLPWQCSASTAISLNPVDSWEGKLVTIHAALTEQLGKAPRIQQIFLTDDLFEYLMVDWPSAVTSWDEMQVYLQLLLSEVTDQPDDQLELTWRYDKVGHKILVCALSKHTHTMLAASCFQLFASTPVIQPLFGHFYDRLSRQHHGQQPFLSLHANSALLFCQSKAGWLSLDSIKFDPALSDTAQCQLLKLRIEQALALANLSSETDILAVSTCGYQAIQALQLAMIPIKGMTPAQLRSTCLGSAAI